MGLLLVAGASATVVQQTSLDTVHGEMATAPSDFVILPQGVQVEALGLAAAGTTPGTAVELDLVPAVATPGVGVGNYAYSVQAQEVSAGIVPAGNFTAQLLVDGVPAGTVYFTQGTDLPATTEVVRLTWDLGATPPAGSVVYRVTVAAS